MKKLESAVAAILDKDYRYAKQPDGMFRMEIYADYWDGMDGRTAAEICGSADSAQALSEKLDEWYFEAELAYQADFLAMRHQILSVNFKDIHDI